MGWDEILLVWCGLWAVVALVGLGRSLAGVTADQRKVRLTGRIVRVTEPRHGGSRKGGIPVVVRYRDPVSGEEVEVTNDGERGEMITVAWEGRELGIGYPLGRPHAYRFSDAAEQPGRGLDRPAFAFFLVCAGLVALAAVRWGWPWALIGVAGSWAVAGIVLLPGAVRDKKARLGRLAALEAVPGRVVAVLRDVSVDEDGDTSTTITPVLSFTTRDGTAVTAHCRNDLPGPPRTYGLELTVHHDPSDPAVFMLDRSAGQRSAERGVLYHVVMIVVLVATTVAGVVLL
ncbi:DUF3592 domain-containing protein [Kitasatospora sp. NPDC059827]|uniref:DUF3592 domain-containing protein n=1 Tax=Kitasatospora sp. NPDC059827 TaxID=3346964 RepID=UPI0036586B63